MGLILDSSVIIVAERRRESPPDLMRRIYKVAGDQELALSAIGYTELVHGIYRADSSARASLRESFLADLSAMMNIYAFTDAVAEIAGRIDGEQTAKGNSIPFADLLIGATALSLGFSVLTTNERHFRLIPGLDVIAF